ncbi:MAG: glycosyl hydrolase, partial [Lachnospiraceae bacterium]
NTIHRKLASSAAHVYGKTIISNESFTWLRFPRFTVTLENIKAAADSIFLDGMNQIVNHGYAYSPEDSSELGWPFYASSQINHKNTWWPYYKYVSVYMNRVCDFLRRGKTKINLAIYLPQADIWAENPLSDIHMCMKLEERMTTEIVDGIHKAGFWFDYVNDEVLTHWQDYEYEGLMLLECDRITIETARNIEAFATSGRAVICKGHVPRRSCGLLEYEENTKGINEIFGELVDKNLCKVTADTLQDVTEILGKYISRDVIFEYHKETIGYVHQVEDEKDIYFISNISNEKKKERITFFNQIKHFVAMDPMTAMEKELLCVTQDGKNTIIDLDMEPYQSIIFVFTPQMMDEYKVVKPVKEINFLDVSENWEFSVPNKGFQKKYQRLNGWELEQELKYYSGEGVYQKEFVITQTMQNIIKKSTSMILQLEHIGEVATIYLNDAEVGNLFMKPYKIDITSFLKQGVNTLEIRVKNLLINRAIDPSYPQDDYKEPVITEWPYTTEKLNRGRQERVYNWRERDMIKVPVTSGIWGKIEIKSIEK